ncbi:MAG: ABC-F family ATP-binding cassette domain-containing protein, partial [Bacteroidetes bacterium]|nr:ABC-F family ATP-binding cassette domain-containing protein [Bacteroidota bacterium]
SSDLDPVFDENNTVMEQVFLSSGEMMHVIGEYENSLVSDDRSRLQQATEKMDALSAWDYEAKIKQILGKLKITDFNQKIGELSGGQRKRIGLANVLIKNADLLILDEPTNHLDLEMIDWLEEYLKKSSVTLLMVTHDRYFLDRVCNEVIEIENKQLFYYQGNYTRFLEKREERLMNDNVNVEKARNLLRKELEWIRRQPKARTTKSKARIDAFYQLKNDAVGRGQEKLVKLNVKGKRLGNKIIDIENLNKSFGSIPIVKDFSYSFIRYEKVGIIGNNGTGKSTLLNMITGSVIPDSGSIEVGATINFAHYSQAGMSFDENMKVIDVAREIAEVVFVGNGVEMGVSQFLNYFLFPPEVQYSYVYKLSGGEKRRLYLATVLMKNPNFLILDEPTNDLDILTLNVLEEYLQNFKGCVIIVSHDRYFMNKIVDHLFVFEGNGIVTDFPGNYSEYRFHIQEKERQLKTPEKQEKKNDKNTITPVNNKPKKLSYKEQKELEQLTPEIEQLEIELKTLEESLVSGLLNHEKAHEVSNKMMEITALIEDKTNRWIELGEIIISQSP